MNKSQKYQEGLKLQFQGASTMDLVLLQSMTAGSRDKTDIEFRADVLAEISRREKLRKTTEK